MSYPSGPAVPAVAEAPSRPPAVVVLAAALLALMALGGLGSAVVGLATMNGTVDRFRGSGAGSTADAAQVDGVAALLRASTVVAAVLALSAAVLLTVLALGLLTGRNGMRVAAWVVCGVGLLCGCSGLVVLVGQRAVPLRLGADERTTAELLAALSDAYPSWWIPLNAGLSVGQALGYLVVATLLALPAASGWFRRPPSVPPRP